MDNLIGILKIVFPEGEIENGKKFYEKKSK